MRFILAMFVIGGVLVFFGVQELRLRSATEDQPQSIPCGTLAAEGPGENAHIVLQDFLLCDFAFVYEEKGSSWSKVWVPAVPLGGEYHLSLLSQVDGEGRFQGQLPLPKNVNVIVKSSSVSNESELDSLANQETLQGVIVNEIESLGSEEKGILKDSYPGVDFDQCWILEVGRKPASTGKMAGLFGGGLGLVAVGGFFVLRGLMGDSNDTAYQFDQEIENKPAQS